MAGQGQQVSGRGSQARAGGELGARGAWAGGQCSERGRPGWGWFSWEDRQGVGRPKWSFLGLLLRGLPPVPSL